MAISLYLAFTNYDTLSGQGTFIGLGNFQRMFFEDPRYGRSVKATVQYVVLSVPLRLAVALVIAMLLNAKRRGVYFYRAAYYIPSIIGGSVAVAVMWRQLFGSRDWSMQPSLSWALRRCAGWAIQEPQSGR